MPARLNEPVASTRAMRHRKSAGSAKLANVTSRLAPMPSKLDPVSSPASTRENRPSASREAKAMRSPEKLTTDWRPSSGRKHAARIAVTVTATGASRKIQVVEVLYTTPLRHSFARSKYSW